MDDRDGYARAVLGNRELALDHRVIQRERITAVERGGHEAIQACVVTRDAPRLDVAHGRKEAVVAFEPCRNRDVRHRPGGKPPLKLAAQPLPPPAPRPPTPA